MNTYCVYYKRIGLQPSAPESRAFVRAADEQDARRIMAENLDTSVYVVTWVSETSEYLIKESDITVNFPRTMLNRV